jgi:hypothetical protein
MLTLGLAKTVETAEVWNMLIAIEEAGR